VPAEPLKAQSWLAAGSTCRPVGRPRPDRAPRRLRDFIALFSFSLASQQTARFQSSSSDSENLSSDDGPDPRDQERNPPAPATVG